MSEAATKPRIDTANLPVTRKRLPPKLATGARPHGLAPGELVKLHHALAASLDVEQGAVIQFLAPEPDTSSEAVVYDLAYISAAWLGKRVLFVNATGMRLEAAEKTDKKRQPVPAGRMQFGDQDHAITRVLGLELYQMVLPSMRGALDMAPTLRRMPDFMTRLRDSFDLVVVASPPASQAPMGVLLSRFVDGNVLVLESGRTRAPTAASLRDALSTSGGAVIGVVLTRCRSYVPRFLRRWL